MRQAQGLGDVALVGDAAQGAFGLVRVEPGDLEDEGRALVDGARGFDQAAAQGAGLLRAGVSESQLTQEIHDLAAAQFGVTTHWHRKVVRAGANTVATFYENPPETVLGEDDLVFVDLGPVFGTWEADYGRTFVLGGDPEKLRLPLPIPDSTNVS